MEVDIDKELGSFLLTKLATRDRPIPDPYKFLQAALHELRVFVVALEPDDGRAAVLASVDRLIDRAERLRRFPRESVWFLPRKNEGGCGGNGVLIVMRTPSIEKKEAVR